jgi:hypothetical protein
MIQNEISIEKQREDYLRVTSVLYPFSGLEKIDADVLAYAAERGTKVHNICEGIVAGLGEIGVEDETWGYVESFKNWWEAGQTIVEMEKRFWEDDLLITGQLDFIVADKDGLAIVDIKTSSRPSKTWPAQGAAYAMLAKKAGYDIKKVIFLHLNKNGKAPKLYEYPIDDDFFLAILRVYNHFYAKKTVSKQI